MKGHTFELVRIFYGILLHKQTVLSYKVFDYNLSLVGWKTDYGLFKKSFGLEIFSMKIGRAYRSSLTSVFSHLRFLPYNKTSTWTEDSWKKLPYEHVKRDEREKATIEKGLRRDPTTRFSHLYLSLSLYTFSHLPQTLLLPPPSPLVVGNNT